VVNLAISNTDRLHKNIVREESKSQMMEFDNIGAEEARGADKEIDQALAKFEDMKMDSYYPLVTTDP
jgi:hypothetical protein